MKKSFTIIIRTTICLMTVLTLMLSAGATALANEATGDTGNQRNLRETTPSGIPFSDMEERIAELVSQHIGETALGAAVAIVQDGEVISLQNFGYADVDNGIPVADDTVFEYGSISKLFAYTAAMQLVEQGKLDLDTDIREYLSDDFNSQWNHAEVITMRDLMNHAGGFGDFPFDTLLLDPSGLSSLEEVLLNQRPQQYFTPGTASSYSNYGTALAGFVVESIVGQPFYQIQQEMIFQAAGMDSTAGEPQQKDNPSIRDRKAQGYMPNGQGGFIERGWSYSPLYPAGSANGTAEDLALFLAALMPAESKDTPLFKDNATLSQMLSPSYDATGEMRGMHHGFFSLSGTTQTLGHGGDTAGFAAHAAFAPTEGFGMVVVTNGAGDMDIRFGLHNLLFGSSQTIEDNEFADGLPSAEEVVGSYLLMQVPKGNMMEFMGYISPLQVEAVGENRIALHLGPLTGNFVQIAPYEYLLQGDSHPMFVVFPSIRFIMNDGEVTQVAVGNGMDMIPAASQRSATSLALSAVAVVIGLVFFLAAPAVLLVQAIRRKKLATFAQSKNTNRWQTVVTLLGTALVMNNLVALGSFMANSYRSPSSMMPHLVMNYVIALAALIFIALLVYSLIKEKGLASKARIITAGITVVLLAAFTAVLASWNFFTLFI